MAEKVDIAEFARRVERVCDFFLSKIDLVDGSPDVRVIQDLKEAAADIHMGGVNQVELTIAGLDAFLRNHPEA